MKYTVVIEQAVPEEQQAQLQQALASRFQLSADQARKLATRRGGRLMKPTGRERAAVLLEIFKEVNAQVRLEEVAEVADTAEPGAVPAGVGQSSGRPPSPLPINQPDLHATEFGQVMREQSVATLDNPVMVARTEPGLSGISAMSAAVPAGTAATLAPAADNFWDELAAPAFIPSAASTAGGLFTPDTGSSQPEISIPETQVLQTQALQTQSLLASQPVSMPARTDPSAELFGLGSPGPDTTNPNTSSLSSSSLGGPDAAPADSWSDFTGALTMTDTPTAPKVADEAPEMVMQSAENDTPLGRRQPLLRRLTVASVTPLAVYTVLTLGTLSIVLTSSQRSLISTSAATIAAAVGSVLNTTDQNTVNQQLGTLLNRQSVGFVQVELPDGTTFFRSQSPGLDAVLGERVGTWVKSNPSSGVFVQNDTPAQLYNAQLQQLVSVGAQDSEPAAALKRAVNNPDNQTISNRNFQVERIGVYAKPDGSRETKGANEKSANTLLYRIAVGVPIDSAQNQLRNTLLILLAAGLLAMLLGAALAARAARRIVQPIERLVTAADAISLGDLSQSVKAEANDEVGDLAEALERMRLSLDAAMERLRKRRKT